MKFVPHNKASMNIFKAYDIRGVYPSELDEDMAYAIGRAFVCFLKCKSVVIGRDMRLSSPSLFAALSRGILDQGADVTDIGLSTTDMAYYCCYALHADAGIMITASHNPKEDNGFKLFREKAIPLSEETGIKQIAQLVQKGNFPQAPRGGIQATSMVDSFVQFAISFASSSLKRARPLKIVVDCGNGMAGMLLHKVFHHFPHTLIPLYEMPDGNFPHHVPNPLVEENRADLTKKVKYEHADLGIAFDGDCDRCFFVDDQGMFIPGDFILGLLAKNVLKTKPGLVLYDVRCSWYVRDVVSRAGGTSKECRVGHAFLKHYVREYHAVLAGEVSGHYYYPYKDLVLDSGWITTVKILDILAKEKKPLSQLLMDTKKYHLTGELNFTVRDKDRVLQELAQRYADGKQYITDGLSIVYADWHCNVRKSNTEPLLRLNLEATSQKLMEQKRDEVKHIITRT